MAVPNGSRDGISSTLNVTSGEVGGRYITGLTLTLNISGGYNGDLYAYVVHNGIMVPLLNRVGVGTVTGTDAFGYANGGFLLTLGASTLNDIHLYQNYAPSYDGGALTGVWAPDGRAIDPLSSAVSFDTAGRTGFDSYTGQNPTGDWTLYVADVVGGGGSSYLTSWSMDIMAIPEPMNIAAALFLGCFSGFHLLRYVWRRRAALLASCTGPS